MKMEIDFRVYISQDPNIRFGKPCVKGTRIAVVDVLSYLASGMTPLEIVDDFPELSLEAIDACVAYETHREKNKLTLGIQ